MSGVAGKLPELVAKRLAERKRERVKDHEERCAWLESKRIDLPETSCIDTVRMSLLSPLHPRDLANLERRGFQPACVKSRITFDSSGRVLVVHDERARYQCEQSLSSVHIMPTRVAAEFSVARAFGNFHNLMTPPLSPAEIREALRSQTEGLLPWTTLRAKWNKHHWGITRIDLARDVEVETEGYRAAYGATPWRRTRRPAPKVYTAGLCWQGDENVLRIYDKRKQVGDRVGSTGSSAPLMRVERQSRGGRAMARLGELLRYGRPGYSLPFVEEHDGHSSVVRRPLDYTMLHYALARDIDKLDRPMPPTKAWDEEVARRALDDRSLVLKSKELRDPKTHRKMLARMEAYSRSDMGVVSLLNACYGH